MIDAFVLLAWFTNPLLLGWLAAASAPLIIHLWNKRKYREVTWAAIDFLLAALRKNSRRIQVEQWLLLAVRTLIIVLVVLALAEPFLEQAGIQFSAGQRTHKVLVLDGSFSMGFQPADRSRFDRAKELAVQIVDESHQGDGFTLVLLADPPRVIVGTPAFERADFVEEIQNLRLPHGGANLPQTIDKIAEILLRAQREQPRLVQSEVYFLTDLGRHGWLPHLEGTAAVERFRQQSKQVSEMARLVVVDLGQAASENLAVTDLAVAEPYLTLGRDATITATVQNFGRQPHSRQLVELYVDGRRAGEEYVSLEPGGQTAVGFSYRFESPGDHAVEVRLAGDLLSIDNHRWLSVPVKEQVRVLVIDGKPSSEGLGGAAGYLAVALNPHNQPAGRQAVAAEVATERALLETDLSAFDAIFLANVQQFTRAEAQVLHAYLKQGGGLVFFLGDQVRPDSYNDQLYPEAALPRTALSKPEGTAAGPAASGPVGAATSQSGAATGPAGAVPRVLPARLAAIVAESQYRFQPGDYRHPIIQAFRGQERAGLLSTPVYRYFKLEVPEGGQARVALAFENGDPVIVEEPIERGRAILVATSADVSWTTMPMWPSYVPIVQELLSAALGRQADQRNVLVGQPLAGSLRAPGDDLKIEVVPPVGESRKLHSAPQGDFHPWQFSDTDQSGLYQARLIGASARQETFAVNVDPAESDLARIDLAELKGEEVWPGIPFVVETNFQDLSANPQGEISRRAHFHLGLLYAALGLVLSESVLAWFFGRRLR